MRCKLLNPRYDRIAKIDASAELRYAAGTRGLEFFHPSPLHVDFICAGSFTSFGSRNSESLSRTPWVGES